MGFPLVESEEVELLLLRVLLPLLPPLKRGEVDAKALPELLVREVLLLRVGLDAVRVRTLELREREFVGLRVEEADVVTADLLGLHPLGLGLLLPLDPLVRGLVVPGDEVGREAGRLVPGLDFEHGALLPAVWVLLRVVERELQRGVLLVGTRLGAAPDVHLGVEVEHHHVVVDQVLLGEVEDLLGVQGAGVPGEVEHAGLAAVVGEELGLCVLLLTADRGPEGLRLVALGEGGHLPGALEDFSDGAGGLLLLGVGARPLPHVHIPGGEEDEAVARVECGGILLALDRAGVRRALGLDVIHLRPVRVVDVRVVAVPERGGVPAFPDDHLPPEDRHEVLGLVVLGHANLDRGALEGVVEVPREEGRGGLLVQAALPALPEVDDVRGLPLEQVGVQDDVRVAVEELALHPLLDLNALEVLDPPLLDLSVGVVHHLLLGLSADIEEGLGGHVLRLRLAGGALRLGLAGALGLPHEEHLLERGGLGPLVHALDRDPVRIALLG
mmetsp:Transcript_16353/g.40312  ORF Transcript_16353/g.40312 Transcript_16353/m.40312 type:complete len:499 (+) Transcript_16353:176-1672(+)